MTSSGLATWAAGIASLGYDDDEVMRTHAAMLVARGLIRYRDFFDCHPPWFGLLAPIARSCHDNPSDLMWARRVFSTVGNRVFLVGLAVARARDRCSLCSDWRS